MMNEQYEKGHYDGYIKGYEAGKASAEADEALKEYEAGQSDLWEAVRKIILPPEEGGIDVEVLKEMFDYAPSFATSSSFSNMTAIDFIFKKYTSQEVINKINEYEANKIEVGDEVQKNDSEQKLLVTFISSNHLYFDGIDSEGNAYQAQKISNYTKTGRYFNIKNIFDKMKSKGDTFEW